MRGEHYYLVLIGKDGTKYKVFSKPITLKEMDERTTRYENKNELISTIIQNKGLNMKPSDFKDAEIWMEPTGKDKETYKRESSPLYKKDVGVLDVDRVASKYEVMMFDRKFALLFAKKYKKVKNFKPIAEGIEGAIRNNGDYIELMQDLGEKLFKTYKGSRNIYMCMKKYENSIGKEAPTSKPESVKSEDISYRFEHNLSQSEIEEDRLRYLLEHERELLDIEDFYNHKDISCFDEHKRK